MEATNIPNQAKIFVTVNSLENNMKCIFFVIKFQSKKPLSSVYNQSATTITFLKSFKVSSWQGWVGKAKKSTRMRGPTPGVPRPTLTSNRIMIFFSYSENWHKFIYIHLFLYIFFTSIHFFINESLFNLHLLLRNWTACIAFYKATKLNMVDNEEPLKLRILYQVPRWSYPLKLVHLGGYFSFFLLYFLKKASLPTLSLFRQDAT